ncbi:MAG: TonB-dependent receptor plug domain-containing protein, partial [Opitutaceae bacterium]
MKKPVSYLAALLVLANAGYLTAQTAAPAPSTPPDQVNSNVNAAKIPVTTTPANQPPSDQSVVTLNPFEVSASKDVGYQATETLAGTRIATKLGDVAASISVIDKQFLQDIGATDNGTLLEYTTDAVVASPMGTYSGVGNGQSYSEQGRLDDPQTANRIRGLTSADNAINYYITDIPWDSYNVSRIDILRGPNSILYGLGSPAGIINASTNQADFYDHGQITARTGSYGSARGTLDLNEVLIPNVLAVRIDALWDNTNYEQQPAFQDQKRLYGTITYDPQIFKNPSFHTSIKINWDHGEINANGERLVPPGNEYSAWWRPNAVSASNPFGGMGQAVVNNPYDPWTTTGNTPGSDLGMINATSPNYQPWLADNANAQQPIWFMDGSTGALEHVYGGFINGGINSAGNPLGESVGLPGRGNAGVFYGLGSLSQVANGYKFPGYQYGQYKNQSIMNPSIFDFYDTLIDGPTKYEDQDWNALNADFEQTALDGRIGLDLTFDRQRYKRSAQALLGYQPNISIDLNKNFADYYLYNNGEGAISNPNYGRPFVMGAGNNGGNSYSSDREVNRASLFAEFRTSDVTSNSLLIKLLGRHRFNFVASNEKYWDEERSWDMYANSQAWDGFWNGNNGLSNGFAQRPPLAAIYLGGSVLGQSTPAGANIPGITAPISLQSNDIYVFNPTYSNFNVPYGSPWTVPANMAAAYAGGIGAPGGTTQLYQDSNPANLVGWSNFQDDLLTDNGGAIGNLLTVAEKSLRETTSYSGNYQGYLLNNALVVTLGWRYDDVGTKDVTAPNEPLNRNMLNLTPTAYSLPGIFPTAQVFEGHSTSGGAVLHLNDLLPRDPLPIDVSLTY